MVAPQGLRKRSIKASAVSSLRRLPDGFPRFAKGPKELKFLWHCRFVFLGSTW